MSVFLLRLLAVLAPLLLNDCTGTGDPPPFSPPTLASGPGSTALPTETPPPTHRASETENEAYLPHIASTPTPEIPPAIYWGAYIPNAPWNMDDLDAFEGQVGKAVSLVHFGYPWVQDGAFKPFPRPQMDAIRGHGAIPIVGWGSWHLGLGQEQPDFRLDVISSGQYDDFLREWAQAAAAWGHPFFLKFDWEMDGTWQFPWSVQVNGNKVEDFVPAWRHVHDIFSAAGASNVTWVWCPTTVSQNSAPLPPLYPGDDYVDWTCLHGYNFNDPRWLSFSQVFSGYPQNPFDSYAQLLEIAPGKPVMLGEWASAEAGDGGHVKAGWIRDALQVQIPENYPAIKAIVWFNWNAHEGRSWTVDSSPTALQAFRESIALPVYAGDGFADLKATTIEPLLP